jgi:UDP-N-acetyl-D-glucosamine/UDP-N-acetyl-D-galactosamine dehydrogenase
MEYSCYTNMVRKKFMNKIYISVIGLGYVGLPLALALSKKFNIIGFDKNIKRLKELKLFKDTNKQFSKNEIKNNKIKLTNNINELKSSNVFIFCLPTPITRSKKPNISALKSSTISISKILKKGDTLIYESTVYPGLTEEIFKPLIEKHSNLMINKDIGLGYSPERINPGDKKRTITKIKKVISASNNKTLNLMSHIYGSIIKAGIFKAESIKVAEAAKVIENTQRDINIAFVNELSIIFNKMNINTSSVLAAAKTKWNFLDFSPGLVGGHCIGVDPYYLTYKAKILGYTPKVILSGRSINENMENHIISKIMNFKKTSKLKKIKCIVFGVTFKENCSDFRNSKMINIINKLKLKKNYNLQIHDPIVNKVEFKNATKFDISNLSNIDKSDVIIIGVNHDQYANFKFNKWCSFLKKRSFIVDIKSLINPNKLKKTKNIVLSQL